jgi:hypothetical protein
MLLLLIPAITPSYFRVHTTLTSRASWKPRARPSADVNNGATLWLIEALAVDDVWGCEISALVPQILQQSAMYVAVGLMSLKPINIELTGTAFASWSHRRSRLTSISRRSYRSSNDCGDESGEGKHETHDYSVGRSSCDRLGELRKVFDFSSIDWQLILHWWFRTTDCVLFIYCLFRGTWLIWPVRKSSYLQCGYWMLPSNCSVTVLAPIQLWCTSQPLEGWAPKVPRAILDAPRTTLTQVETHGGMV